MPRALRPVPARRRGDSRGGLVRVARRSRARAHADLPGVRPTRRRVDPRALRGGRARLRADRPVPAGRRAGIGGADRRAVVGPSAAAAVGGPRGAPDRPRARHRPRTRRPDRLMWRRVYLPLAVEVVGLTALIAALVGLVVLLVSGAHAEMLLLIAPAATGAARWLGTYRGPKVAPLRRRALL